MTLKDIKDYIVARIYNNNTQKITGDVLQDTLSTMADSMNTPSGDPMHYVYLSHDGVSYDETTGLFSLGYLTDLTAEDMRKAFATYGGGVMSVAYNSWVGSYGENARLAKLLPRTTLPSLTTGSRLFYDKVRFNFSWGELEQIYIGILPSTPTSDNTFKIWQYNSSELMFNLSAMQKLKYIVDPLYCNMTYTLSSFSTLPKLEEVRLLGLKGNVSFAGSPNLSKESILYMISNSGATSNITITLHATAYAMAMADADTKSALASKTYVKLASA